MSLFDVIIVQPILNLLMAIYAIIPGGDFGISVVIFTIVIRFALWPLAKKQLHQAKAMRKMQPELKKIKEKYKNNSQAQGLAMMDLYKKHNINPFGSIGVLIVQLPILIAIYRVVQIFAMRREDLGRYTYGFMENLPAVKELITDTTHFNQNFLGLVDLTQHAVSNEGIVVGLVIIALTASMMQYFLSKQMSPSTDNNRRLRDILAEAGQGKEADQAEMNAIMMRKMTKFMPIFLFFIMISLPGAIALYIATGNIVAYFQNTTILKKDKDEMMAISSEKAKSSVKKTTKQRVSGATEAKITKIKAKDK